MSARSDGDLLHSFVATGSDEAFRALVERYAALVYALCLGELSRPELAEDASQAVFLLLSRRAERLDVRTSLVGWLYASARLVCKAARREERRRMSRERPLDERLASPAPEAWGVDLGRALARLTPIAREAVVLRFVQGFSLAEVARLQGTSEDAARMRVGRALDRMRPALRGHAQERLGGLVVPSTLLAMDLRTASPHARVLAFTIRPSMNTPFLLAGGGLSVLVAVAIGGGLVAIHHQASMPRPTTYDLQMARLATKPTTTIPFPVSSIRSIPLHLKPDAVHKEYEGVFVFAVPRQDGTARFKVGERSYDVRVSVAGKHPTIDIVPDGRLPVGGGIALAPGRMTNDAGQWFDTNASETTIPGPNGAALTIGFRLVPDTPPTVPQWAGKLIVAPKYAYLGHTTFGGKSMLIGVASVGSGEDFLAVDRNGDGRAGDTLAEMYRLDEPFNLGGTTYRARLAFHEDRPSLEIATSSQRVAEIPLRPDPPVVRRVVEGGPVVGVREARPSDRKLPPAEPVPPPLPNGVLAPDFTAYAPDGRPVSLSGLRGKVTILDFWASWCGPCQRSMPGLENLYRRVKAQGAVVFSVNTWDTEAGFLKWVRENAGSRYTFEFARDPIGGDDDAAIKASIARSLYHVGGIPTMFVVDRKGRIAGSFVGYGPSTEPGLARVLRRVGLRL